MREVKKALQQFKGFTVPVIILVICVVGVLYGILPTYERSRAIREKVEVLEKDVALLTEKVSLLDSLDEQSVRTQLTAMTLAVPGDKSIPTLFSTVDTVAGQAGGTVTEMSIANAGSLASESGKRQSAEERKMGGSVIPFNLTLEATFEQTKDFFTRTEGVRRLLKIKGFTVSFKEDKTTAKMELNTFYVPFPKAIGSVDQKLVALTAQEETLISRVASLPLAASEESAPPPSLPSEPRLNPFAP